MFAHVAYPQKKGKKRKRQKNVWPTLDADAHIFRAASSFWTRKGASDAASPGRRPCAERRGRRAEDQEKKSCVTRPGIEPGSAPWQGAILPLDQRVLFSLSIFFYQSTRFPSGLYGGQNLEFTNHVPCYFRRNPGVEARILIGYLLPPDGLSSERTFEFEHGRVRMSCDARACPHAGVSRQTGFRPRIATPSRNGNRA